MAWAHARLELKMGKVKRGSGREPGRERAGGSRPRMPGLFDHAAMAANTLRAAAMVASMTASSCWIETKPASNAAGAK
jgi:hypothetical protein